MKRIILVCLAVLAFVNAAAASRVASNFDKDWKFILSDPENAQDPSFKDASWRTLDLPHDWSIEGENLQDNPGGGSVGYFPMGTGWYRKTFSIKGYSKNKLYSIEFDGVYMNSTVWINGHELGTWPYGYSSFSYDLTPYLKASGNVIAVRVDNSQQTNSRWYSGSGIYRHVRLVETGKTCFKKWGVFNYTQEIKDGEALVKIESSVVNSQTSEVAAVLRQSVLDDEGNVVAQVSKDVVIAPGGTLSENQVVSIPDARLWKLDSPYLYTLRSSLLVRGKVIDSVDNTLGVRTILYDVDKGFFLNGEHVKMLGVNVHHDGGAVGAAVPERVWERRLEILKEGGCNAIRTAHNAPAPEFLDLCDRLGMLVMDEAFDQWESGKNKFDYHLYYKDWHETDLAAMVERDRNHPSVVMWSVGNEVRDQHSAEGALMAKDLISICHRLDPTRLVTSGNDEIASNSPTSEAFMNAFDDDILGYNYPDRWRTRRAVLYALDKAQYPGRRVVATESTGVGGPRGVYYIPPKDPQPVQEGQNPEFARMMRRFRNQGIISNNLLDVEWRWRFTMDYDYVIGDFMWTGIDYYGESGWPSRGSTSGYLDNCGFKKDGYYFFKSIWTDEPVLHLFPHWNWEGHEGQIIQVACYTNCEDVELFVNGKSYGKKTTEFPRQGVDVSWAQYGPGKRYATTSDLHLVWDVEYQPGEIKVVGTKNGEQFEEVIRTAGKPASIRLSVDRDSFKADPSDVAHVTAEILDAEGNIVPLADNLVKFEVSGGKLVGVESGNMADLSSVLASERKAYSGKCLAIVGASKAGSVMVKATSDGLEASEITFIAR